MANEPTKLDISDEMIAERRGGSGPMPSDMPKWMASTITKIDLANKWIGNVVCWIVIPLTFTMVYEVLARKLFNAPTMWAYDMSRFLYGALFMLGAGYALSKSMSYRIYENGKALAELTGKHGVILHDTPADYFPAYMAAAKAALEKNAAKNPFFAKVWQSQKDFADIAVPFWSGSQMSNAKLGMAHAETLK